MIPIISRITVSSNVRFIDKSPAIWHVTRAVLPFACTAFHFYPRLRRRGVLALAGGILLESRQFVTRNLLLSLMSLDDLALLQPHLTLIPVKRGFVIHDANVPITHIYFPENSIASIVAVSPEGQRIEAGIIGREGVTGVPVLLGSDRSSNECMIQIEGSAWQLTVEALRAAIDQSPSLRHLLLRFAQTFSTQIAYTALSNALHIIDERLARWILMCHDRLDEDNLMLTHEFLSFMLGVRRPSVTTSLHTLEGTRMIRADRGHITVRDREGLEDFARDAYGIPEREYSRLIGDIWPSKARRRQLA